MGKLPFIGGSVSGPFIWIRNFFESHRMWLVILISTMVWSALLIALPLTKDAQAHEKKRASVSKKTDLVVMKGEGIFFGKIGSEVKSCNADKEIKSVDMFVVKENEFEKELYELIGNHPIKEMVPYIAKKDKKVAAFLVGIAKKESNWGKRVPTLNGKDCYNYWGYKGSGELGSAMGYACFASTEEAVAEVGGRLERLVEKKLDTPGKMVVWKCGSSCESTGGQAAADKWIRDVSVYFERISKSKA